ncbi:MAG: hypothetical protein AMJ84_00270 [Acidithiobacillales bacterium SM23_46]|nr:MAG: hypothetical protein AMJ84_00270 [Acidithiobacillales bacterium SM23_46]KPL29009.1 MAG: hypothetical protein AMJ72_00180 [Acidithiobacillales bacterium SM1_46]
MSEEITVKDAAKAIATSKALLASIIAAFTLMSAVGIAILEWRVSVNVAEALAAQDLGTDAKIVAMDSAIADNKRTGSENAEDIEQNRERVEAAFAALLGRQNDP